MEPRDIKIIDYNYILPPERIAQFPLKERDETKLLIYRNKNISETIFKNISDYIPEDSLLVMNDTKVIQARLHFTKETGALIEIFCLEPHQPELNINLKQKAIWKCLVGNAGKWKHGSLKKNIKIYSDEIILEANILEREFDYFIVEFNWDAEKYTFNDILNSAGMIPLPPYIEREPFEADKYRYQTIYAKTDGSVAAPTAGLHFTESVFNNLKNKNIEIDYITLNIGTGTFKPVKTETIGEHDMHFEHFIMNKKSILNLQNFLKKNIIAVGTTTMRTIESLYLIGLQLYKNKNFSGKEFTIGQWEAYEGNAVLTAEDALNEILNYLEKNNLDYLTAKTGILIAPGYKFKFINTLITNFHLPKSTLLLLIAAFIGEDWRKVYYYALKNNFRFLSYGDSSILFSK
jgi:S-adenosylmethionine:tRNA ribosyltransferase-isomerase